MAAIGNGSMVVMSGDCHFLFDNGAWTCVEAGFDFGHVEDAWGMRDANGQLQLYAIGDDGDNSGLKVWKYNENDPNLHDGIWVPVVLDPMSGHVPDIGSGFHLWGNAGDDVYATGVVNGEGHMLRFNGTSWVQLLAPQPFGAIHGVWGTPQGAVWFSAEGGTMIRYLPQPAAGAAPAAKQPLAASERNGALLVRYELPAVTRVHIGVYDVAGRMRGTVEDGVRTPGVHETSWNGAELVPGVYFVKLRTDRARSSRICRRRRK